jgi:endonuclease/exonuclease/phosphatase family metal-dependent hydrolase
LGLDGREVAASVTARERPGRGHRPVRAILTAMLLAALVPTGDAAGAATLRFVTFNAYHGGPTSGWTGDGRFIDERLAIAADQLRALAPDVIALQEASAGRGRGNIAARLARALGFHHVYAPASLRAVPIPLVNLLAAWILDFEEGPAILSRFPIVRSEIYDLPRCRTYLDPRVLLRAEIDAPRGRLQVFSAHTSGLECQVQRAAEIARSWRGPMPSILMGDFNGLESAGWIAALTNGGGFVDAFRAARPREAGATTWQRIDGLESTARRRVDYIFLLPGTETAGEILDSRVVLDRPGQRPDGTPLWASDHYGVLADVAIGGGPSEAGIRASGRPAP